MNDMQAWRIHRFGGPEVIQCDQVSIPEPDAEEVLVRVLAESTNPVDLKTREGNYPLIRAEALPYVLGRDFSGIVERAGASASV